MDLSFERGEEIKRETRHLPAEHYKKILLLFSRSRNEHLFIPIRSMQYLAIIDQEEIVFVDGQDRRNIEITWCDFQREQRENLSEPVSYTCIYYEEKGLQIMQRLQSEFFKALELVEDRQPKSDGASVTPLVRDE